MPAPPTGALLTARDLARRHPGTADWLYRGIDLEIEAGDRWALVGPTGSGKSLILRAIALLDPTDLGEIYWRGQTIPDDSVPEYRAHVLYLQQRSPVIEGTVEENLKLPFTMRLRQDSPYPRSQLVDLLQNLDRGEDFLTSRTTNLSGGERQMVALLRALLVSPTVLLLDEPSAALDPQTTTALERLVDAWQTQAATERAYVWVTHDAEQAQRVADRVVHLEQGLIEAVR